jgi:energy-coupling factor transporter ATP-binding protein EcfA2
MKRTLFVSYSHDAIDRDKLDYLLERIQKKGRSTVRVLIDLKEVRLGGSFTDYMALIDSYNVDAAMVVLTPSYKAKVDRNEGNVPPEFRAIYSRYQNDREAYAQTDKSDLDLYEHGRQFGLLPVVLNGRPDDVVPRAIVEESIRYWDISSTVVHRNREGALVASGPGQRQIEDLADQIVVELKNIAKHKDKEYQERRARIRAALFANTKAGAHPTLEAEVFVRTMTYEKVRNQESHFIVGRKGSGKSTLTEQLELQNPNRYSNHVRIDFSRISLSFIYSYYTDRQFLSDSASTRSYRAEFLELVWECFFLMCLMWHRKDLDYFSTWLTSALRDDITDYTAPEFFNAALSHSIEKFQEFQNTAITQSRDSLASLPARLSARRFLEFAFGKSLVRSISAIAAEGKTLVTLDGIDSAFHDYRLEYMRFDDADTEEYYQKRAKVELDLIKALMRLVSDVKSKPDDYPILAKCSYCITIPLDLYQEIKGYHERDSYKWLTSCRSLDWSGPELALMLRKRVEKLVESEIDKERFYPPKERLLEALDEFYPALPKEVPITIGGRTVEFPIFIYVLRHTFWRPRELIFHFVGLLSSFEYFKGNTPITANDVKAIVKEQAKALVSSEFIDEFKSTIVNIHDIIEEFRGGPQCYEFETFQEKLRSIPFEFYLNPHDERQGTTGRKLRLLYELGFIGFRLSDPQIAIHARPRNVFSFSEGMVIFDQLAREKFAGATVCIHPAFIEYLQIRIDPNQEIVLDINWEYLRENEIRRNAALQW